MTASGSESRSLLVHSQMPTPSLHILKFYLHISKEEQLKRFKERLDDPGKHWKISEADYKERTFWDEYVKAYE